LVRRGLMQRAGEGGRGVERSLDGVDKGDAGAATRWGGLEKGNWRMERATDAELGGFEVWLARGADGGSNFRK